MATYLLQCVHVRGAPDDVAVTTHHWRWEGGAAPEPADFEAVEARHQAFWTTLASYITTKVISREYRWYGPRTEPGLWGEAIRVTPFTTGLGTASAGLPQQIACSVTERTDVRKRWGRFYIPCLGVNSLQATATGTFVSTFVTAVCNAAATLLGTDAGSFAPVVFGTPTPTSLPIRAVAVDMVPDVQRRRRADAVTATTVVTF